MKVVIISEIVYVSDREYVFILKVWINYIDFILIILKIKVIDVNDCILKFLKKVYYVIVGGYIIYVFRNSILKVLIID